VASSDRIANQEHPVYVIAHRRGPVVRYELAYEAGDGQGLLIGATMDTYDAERSGSKRDAVVPRIRRP